MEALVPTDWHFFSFFFKRHIDCATSILLPEHFIQLQSFLSFLTFQSDICGTFVQLFLPSVFIFTYLEQHNIHNVWRRTSV